MRKYEKYRRYRKAIRKRRRMKLILIGSLFLTGAVITGGTAAYRDLSRKVENISENRNIEETDRKKRAGDEQTERNEGDGDSEGAQREDSEWNLILVNPWNPISAYYTVELVELQNGQAIDERAYPELQDMMDAMRAEGLSPLICSSYRSAEKQQSLYKNRVYRFLQEGYSQAESESEAKKWVAFPGTSEHQTGLAVDIVSMDYQMLDENQENTREQQWLMENSYKYGWILRYPNEKSAITGIYYEPWHYRYVGKKAAEEIYRRGLCLEEYLEER